MFRILPERLEVLLFFFYFFSSTNVRSILGDSLINSSRIPFFWLRVSSNWQTFKLTVWWDTRASIYIFASFYNRVEQHDNCYNSEIQDPSTTLIKNSPWCTHTYTHIHMEYIELSLTSTKYYFFNAHCSFPLTPSFQKAASPLRPKNTVVRSK